MFFFFFLPNLHESDARVGPRNNVYTCRQCDVTHARAILFESPPYGFGYGPSENTISYYYIRKTAGETFRGQNLKTSRGRGIVCVRMLNPRRRIRYARGLRERARAGYTHASRGHSLGGRGIPILLGNSCVWIGAEQPFSASSRTRIITVLFPVRVNASITHRR